MATLFSDVNFQRLSGTGTIAKSIVHNNKYVCYVRCTPRHALFDYNGDIPSYLVEYSNTVLYDTHKKNVRSAHGER